MKKYLPWIVAVIAGIWIIHNPVGAADAIKSLVNGLSAFATHL